MDAVTPREIELPDPERRAGSVLWHLSERGLEWQGGQSRAAWMPFACMRRITLGKIDALGGWRMRIAGPPGSVLIGASHYKTQASGEADQAFRQLARDIVLSASALGCPPRIRVNDRPMAPMMLWARLGQSVPDAQAILSRLTLSAE